MTCEDFKVEVLMTKPTQGSRGLGFQASLAITLPPGLGQVSGPQLSHL